MTSLVKPECHRAIAYPPFDIPIRFQTWKLDANGGGSGSLGIVKKFDSPDRRQSIAVKKFIKPVEMSERERVIMMVRELECLEKIDHPHIARLLQTYTVEDESTRSIWIYHITEYCGQTLSKKIEEGKHSMEDAKRWTRELLEAVNHLHSNAIVYRNVNPDNICIDGNNKLTLIGFGNSREIDRANSMTANRGKEPHRPLEVQFEWDGPYDEKVDIWSVATILCELITGHPLFDGDDVKNTLKRQLEYCGPVPENVLRKMTNEKERENIRKNSIFERQDFITILFGQMQQGRGISTEDLNANEESLRDFIEHTLQFDPDMRMSAAAALSHRFLQAPVSGNNR